MTGAPVPEGADAVVRVERTARAENDRVRFDHAPERGANIRRAGEDVRAGDTLVTAGVVVTPPVVGMAATLGYGTLEVHRRPRVAVVATGSELVPAAATPGPGQIRNSNGPALAAQAESAGAEALAPRIAGDERAAVRTAFEEAAREADVLLVSGGMSMGAYDFARDVLEAMGMAWRFWKVNQRPGKPFGFGVLDGDAAPGGGRTLVFGLPGNPVSAAVCFEVYVRPALAVMLGRRAPTRPCDTATLDEDLRAKSAPHYFVRGLAATDKDGCMRVRSAGAQGSHVYSTMVAANCLVHLPAGVAHPEAGTRVEIEWLAW